MRRTTLLKILNPILGVLLVSQMATGLFGESLARAAIFEFHEACGIAFAVLAVLHLILNWAWVKATFLPRRA